MSVSSSGPFKFSLYMFFTSWSDLFRGIFEAVVTGVIFLMSFLLGFLLGYKMAIGFSVLILSSATSLTVFISCEHFLVVMSPADKDILTSFPIYIFFTSSYLAVLGMTSSPEAGMTQWLGTLASPLPAPIWRLITHLQHQLRGSSALV